MPFSGGRGCVVALLAAGDAAGPRVHYAQIWAPAGPGGAYSGRSKSHELAFFFRGSRSVSLSHRNVEHPQQ